MIYDCFLFFNELDLLEIRLNVLNDVVDKFVLVESRKTFSGKDKPLFYHENKERFSAFSDKIIHLVYDEDISQITNPWIIENNQRNYISQGLVSAKPDDVILISDLDEIPNPDKILKYKDKSGIKCFRNDFFYYYLNFICVDEPIWYKGTRMLHYKDCAHFLDNVKVKMNSHLPDEYKKGTTINKIRYYKKGFQVRNGGWHFSYLGGAEAIRNKILSISHSEFHKSEYTDLDKIESRVKAGEDIFNRGKRYRMVEIDDKFPKFVRDNINKYQSIILPSSSFKLSTFDRIKIFLKKYC